MDATPYVPVIVEATRFAFSELGKWFDRIRQRTGKTPSVSKNEISESKQELPAFTKQDFAILENDIPALMSSINVKAAETNAYLIKSIVEQIQIHRKNFVDLETVEAQFGVLTPQHIKRGIENEANAIVEKSERLKDLLALVYVRKIENA